MKYGKCTLCDSAIAIPGEDGYLCSSKICGEEIVIKNKKNKQVIYRYPAKGWVKYEALPRLVAKKERLERRNAR